MSAPSLHLFQSERPATGRFDEQAVGRLYSPLHQIRFAASALTALGRVGNCGVGNDGVACWSLDLCQRASSRATRGNRRIALAIRWQESSDRVACLGKVQ
jgi:hypothetical protein